MGLARLDVRRRPAFARLFEGDQVGGVVDGDDVSAEEAHAEELVVAEAGVVDEGDGDVPLERTADLDAAQGAGLSRDFAVGGLQRRVREVVGADTLSGAGSNDTLDGEAGADTLDGGSGSDTLSGGTENDTLIGGAENDVLLGEDGADVLDGGADDDSLVGGSGADTLTGGDGDDTIVASAGAGDDIYNGGADTDTITFTSTSAGVDVDLAGGIAEGAEIGTDDLNAIENVVGGSGGDTIAGNGATNVLDGGDGADTLDGAGGADTLLGGDGGDTLTGGAGADSIVGGLGDDDYDGGADTDTLDLSATSAGVVVDLAGGTATGVEIGADSLTAIENVIAGSGNDTLDGEAGADTLDGGSGSDTFLADTGDGDDAYNGGADTDTADYSVTTAGIIVDFAGGTAESGETGTDTLAAIENVVAGSGDDILIGNGSDNRLEAGGGNDTLTGGDGDDSLDGGADTNLFDLSGISAGVIVDLAAGTATGAEIGADTVTAIENVTAGSGDDTLAGGGTDTADYSDSPGANADLGTGTAVDGLGGTDTLIGIENLTGGAGGDTLDGGADNDILTGDAGTDTLLGGAGADTLEGGADADSLDGGTGNDTVLGGDGDDTIVAGSGAGDDDYDGGADTDIILFTSTSAGVVVDLASGTAEGIDAGDLANVGTDTFTGGVFEVSASDHDDILIGSDGSDFESFRGRGGNDSIDGGGLDDRVDYELSNPGEVQGDVTVNIDTVAQFGLAAGMALDGFGGTDTLANIEHVRGGTANDKIAGNAADNSLLGEAGNDTLIGGDGSDKLFGGDGNDDLDGGNGDLDYYGGSTGDDTLRFGGGSLFYQVDYGSLAGPIVADLSLATVTKGAGGADGTDTLVDLSLISSSSGIEIMGTAGDDAFVGTEEVDFQEWRPGAGTDTITGGPNTDRITYQDAPVGGNVTVDLTIGEAIDWTGATDTFSGIEQIETGQGDDLLIGDAGHNQFRARGGDDSIVGGGGTDELRYSSADGSVIADISAGIATDGFGGTDTFSGIENLRGSGNDDTLTGDGGGNRLRGDGGNNTLIGGDGDDTLDGGADVDTADYTGTTAGITVDLVAGTAIGTEIGTDVLLAIENVTVGSGDDLLQADTSAVHFDGGAGNDTLEGGGGDDTLTGGTGDDTLTGGDGNDRFVFAVGDGLANTILDFLEGDELVFLDLLVADITQTDLGGGDIEFKHDGDTDVTVVLDDQNLGPGKGYQVTQNGDDVVVTIGRRLTPPHGFQINRSRTATGWCRSGCCAPSGRRGRK